MSVPVDDPNIPLGNRPSSQLHQCELRVWRMMRGERGEKERSRCDIREDRRGRRSSCGETERRRTREETAKGRGMRGCV